MSQSKCDWHAVCCGVLRYFFSLSQMHHKSKKIKIKTKREERRTWLANCLHTTPVWCNLLLSVRGSIGPGLVDRLGSGSKNGPLV